MEPFPTFMKNNRKQQTARFGRHISLDMAAPNNEPVRLSKASVESFSDTTTGYLELSRSSAFAVYQNMTIGLLRTKQGVKQPPKPSKKAHKTSWEGLVNKIKKHAFLKEFFLFT